MDIQLPYNTDLERFIIGMLISEPQSYFEVNDYLTNECFYDEQCNDIFKIIKTGILEGNEISLIYINSEIKKRGLLITAYELVKIQGCYYYSNEYLNHAKRLFELSISRKSILTLIEFQQKIQDPNTDIFENIEKIIDNFKNITKVNTDCFEAVPDLINEIIQEMYERTQKIENIEIGVPYGFTEIDRKFKGRQKGDLTIIAAESSQGKTSFALSSILNIFKFGYKIGIISREMTSKQLTARLMSMETKITSNELLQSKIDIPKIQQIENLSVSLFNSNIYIDNTSKCNIDSIIAVCRKMKIKFDVDLIVIDYLQLLSDKSQYNREQEIGGIARKLKNIALELNISIDVISQLSRDQQSPFPKISRLRDSGQIQEAADNVIMIWRPEEYKKYGKNLEFENIEHEFSNISTENKAQIIFAKGRNIGTDDFLLSFEKRYTYFSDIQSDMIYELQQNNEFDNNPF